MMQRNGESMWAVGRWLRLGRVIPVVLVVGGLCWVASGFYTVNSDERGVVTRFGKIHKKVQPGIHYAWPWPIDRVYSPRVTDVKRIEVGFRTKGELWSEPRRSDMLTGDENILKIMMVVQYKIDDLEQYLFRAEEPRWLVERAVESAMNVWVASLSVDDVLTTAKGAIQVRAMEIAQGLLNGYGAGIRLLGGNLQIVDPPVPVMDAFKEVASAKKDSEGTVDKAQGYEGQAIPEARGKAQRMLSEAAAGYADRVNRAKGEANRFESVLAEYRRAKEVTRTRLYVEAMERVLSQAEVIVLERDGAGASTVTIVDK